MSLHDIRYPNESDAYRAARNDLLEKEVELRAQIERVAEMRRSLPLGGEVLKDYVFEEWTSGSSRQTRLSELFAEGRNSLLLYSFMFGPTWERPCPMCTAFLDSLNGNAGHFAQRVNLAVVAKGPIERVQSFADERGWTNLRMLSSATCDYNADYFVEEPDDEQDPACHTFVRREGAIHHYYASELFFVPFDKGHPRHLDLAWPLWALFDTTPDGRGEDWFPAIEYA